MVDVMLDIGAGSRQFARRFRSFNPDVKAHWLCGMPSWDGKWNGVPKARKIQRIAASYDCFSVPDASLSLVTLNAPHPFLMPESDKLERELARTIVPQGGYFISAHPIGVHPNLTEEYFLPLEFTRVGDETEVHFAALQFCHYAGFWQTPACSIVLDETLPKPISTVVYPASRTIANRLRELDTPPESRNRGTNYPYAHTDAAPTVKVWLRNDNPFVKNTAPAI